MRLSTCLFIFLLLFSFGLKAQQTNQKFHFGAKAGANFSMFTEDVDLMDHPDQRYAGFAAQPRISFTGGVTADRWLSRKVIFGAELLYSARGTNYREENTNMPVTYDENGNEHRSYNYLTYRFDYMEIPMVVGYDLFREASNTVLAGYLGIAPALLINHKRKLNYDQEATDLQDQKLDMRYGKDIITNVIGGIRLMERKDQYAGGFLDLRGSYTLSPVFTRNFNDAGRNLNTRMLTLSLALGVRF